MMVAIILLPLRVEPVNAHRFDLTVMRTRGRARRVEFDVN